MPPTIGVGLIGYAFMGAAHSQAWRTAPHFFDLPLHPELTVLAGRNQAAVETAAERLGWASTETDWRRVLERDDVGLVDVCTPGDTHAEIAVAALEAGKHVLCEKPLANSVAEAETMAEAAARAAARGVRSMVGFTYRRVPAIALARKLVAEGRLGTIRHVRAQYLQDWIADPAAPMSWRLEKDKAGSGALGDIGAHIVDLTQYITGQRITGVSGLLETFVGERPLAASTGSLSGAAGEGGRRVTVDDAAVFLGRFTGGGPPVLSGTPRAPPPLRGNPLPPRPQERHPDRDQRLGRQRGVRLRGHERPALLRRHRARRDRRRPADRRHRARAPLRRGLVAGGARAGLRARLHPPGGRPGHRDREGRRPVAVLRRRSAGAARARRGRAQRRRPLDLDPDLEESTRCP